MENFAPSFSFSTSNFPKKLSSIIIFDKYKPIPVPSFFVEKYGSKIFFRFLIFTPPPLSTISIITSALEDETLINISGFSIFFKISIEFKTIDKTT